MAQPSPSQHPPFTPRKTIGISLKMYFNLAQTEQYAQSLTTLLPTAHAQNVSLFFLPTFLSLPTLGAQVRSQSQTTPDSIPLTLGAQNCSWDDAGPFTGEVSPRDLRALGCEIVELGHAERIALCGETEDGIVKKAAAAVRNEMTPLVCVGEIERSTVQSAVLECRGLVERVLQATGDAEVIFAYEPVWAIGKKEPAGSEHVVGVAREIRRICGERRVRILYGGSAGPGTWEGVREGVDGLFLGRFGHSMENLKMVIRELGES